MTLTSWLQFIYEECCHFVILAWMASEHGGHIPDLDAQHEGRTLRKYDEMKDIRKQHKVRQIDGVKK